MPPVPERSDFLKGDAPAAAKVQAFLAQALAATGTDAPTRGITINRPGTYAKAQPAIGFDLTTLLLDWPFVSDTPPTVPVRMMVITGIPGSCPAFSLENRPVREAGTHRYHRNAASTAVSSGGIGKSYRTFRLH